MFTHATVVILILLFGAGFVKNDSEDDGYSKEVKSLFDDLKNFSSEVKTAMNKMNQFNTTWDRKYAIAIINLYTQNSEFYTTLNEEMRKHYPSSSNIWRRAGDLINRALDIITLTPHTLVYRGCDMLDKPPKVGDAFIFNQITSTSENKNTAVTFLCDCGFLFHIENVLGVSVKNYSRYPNENEVLIKSYNVFNVTKGPYNETTNGKTYSVYRLDGQVNLNCKQRRRKRDVNSVCKISSAPRASTGLVSKWLTLVMFMLLFC